MTLYRSMLLGLGIAGLLLAPQSVRADHPGSTHVQSTLDMTTTSYEPATQVAGSLTIAGSDTMQPILAKLAMEFRRLHPDMIIAVQGSRNHRERTVLPLTQAFVDGLANSRRGDGKVQGHLGSQNVELLASSRLLTAEEIRRFRLRHGYEPTAVPIAQDAVAVYVHRDNPMQGLTLQEADAIFSKARKRGAPAPIRTWGQVGVKGEWESAPIRTYGRDLRSSGTLPFFRQIVLLDGEFRSDISMQPGSASVVLAVSNDPDGIGYSGIGFQSSSVRVVPLAEKPGAPYVMPSAESVMSGAYPLSRPLYLYVNKAPGEDLDPKILEFLKFANSREGQATVVRAGVYPVSALQVAANLEALTGSPIQAAVSGNGSSVN